MVAHARAAARRTTPTSGVSDCMPSAGTSVKSTVGVKRQTTERLGFYSTEPNRARFAQKETKAIQRLKIAASPVSEVRLVQPTPFEYKRNLGLESGSSAVCKRKLAEGNALSSNPLGGLLRTPLTVQRITEQTQFSRGFADDATSGVPSPLPPSPPARSRRLPGPPNSRPIR